MFIPRSCGVNHQRHESPSAIFSQTMFLTYNWTALFEKLERRSIWGLHVVKCREFEGEIRWNQTYQEIAGFALTLLEKDRRTEESIRKVWRIETFPKSNFDPATGVKQPTRKFLFGSSYAKFFLSFFGGENATHWTQRVVSTRLIVCLFVHDYSRHTANPLTWPKPLEDAYEWCAVLGC